MSEWSKIDIIKLCTMWNAGKPVTSIARELGHTAGAVRAQVHKQRVAGLIKPRKFGRPIKQNIAAIDAIESALKPIASYQENGTTINVYPRRYARGIVSLSISGVAI